MLLVSFTKGPGGFPYVFIITGEVTTLVPIYGTTLVDHRVFVLGGDQEVLDGAATFEVGLNTISTTDLLDAFRKTLCVGYDNVTLCFDSIGDSLGTCGALVINLINSLTGRLVKSFHHLVRSSFRIFTFSESLPKVVHFLLEQLRPAAHCFGPMGEGIDDTEFS